MSAAALYRAMLKAAKPYDAQSWRRTRLLHRPALARLVAAASGSDARGRPHAPALYFLQQHAGNETLEAIRKQFRAAVQRKGDARKALQRGFDVLRALNSGLDTTPSASSSLTPASTSAASSPLLAAATAAPAEGRRAVQAAVATAAPLAAPRAVRSSAILQASFASTLTASQPTSSGLALNLQRTPPPSMSAQSSILGRLHNGMMELQKPRTPPPGEKPPTPNAAAEEAARLERQAAFTIVAQGEEYLKQLSSSASSAANPAQPSELFLIDSSRMRVQARRWESESLARLSAPQQRRLEALIRPLGTAVEAGSLEDVLCFSSELAAEPSVAVRQSLLSNNRVLDAWIDFLYARQSYSSLLSLFQMRLSANVHTAAFALSRPALAKLLVAAALEGDAALSVQLLRESSWGAINRPRSMEEQLGLEPAPVGTPSAANRLPSWVPAFYASPDAHKPRTPLMESEAEELPDPMLSAAGEGFGVQAEAPLEVPAEVAPARSNSPAPVQSSSSHAPVPMSPPQRRLSIVVPLAHRPLSLSLRQATPKPLSAMHLGQAPMSTRSHMQRRVMRREAEAAVEAERSASPSAAAAPDSQPSPPTPLPIIDLWTELSLDSQLMELAIVAAVRADARKAKAASNAARAELEQRAAANPLHADPRLNLAIYEQAALLFGQAENSPKQGPRSADMRLVLPTADRALDERELEPDSADDEFDFDRSEDEDAQPPSPRSLLASLSDAAAPLAFQLYAVMAQQRIPLQHSATFVQMLQALTQAAGAGATHSTPARLTHAHANVLLQTLSSEFHASRRSPAMQLKFLRSDVEAFLRGEFALTQMQALHSTDSDAMWQAVAVLQSMHAEKIAPPLEQLVQLYRALLAEAAAAPESDSAGRAKLLQELAVLADDFSAVDPDISAEAIVDAAIAGN